MSFSELYLTDGTTKIDLLRANRHKFGFGLQNYISSRAQFKNGGVWQDSPLAVGRHLAQAVETNYNDALTLIMRYHSHQQVINAFEEFDLLIQKAIAYWTTNYQLTPVYLQARARGEQNTRYALVHMAQYSENFNPYHPPYVGGQSVVVNEFVLGIERGPWLQYPPGQGETMPVYHEKSLPAIETSQDFFQNEGVIIGNMHQTTVANPGSSPNGGLRFVYRFDGGVFSGNLLAGNPPYSLFITSFQINDAAYFGSDFPFYGLVFDTSGHDGFGNLVWEFWNGSAWTSFSVTTTSNLFKVTQIGHAIWLPSAVATWAKTNVNADSTNRYWIRLRYTNEPGSGTTIQQNNRHIYATTTSYLEVDDAEVDGTLDALSKIDFYFWNGGSAGTAFRGPFLWAGLRNLDRGSGFAAYLNVGGANPDGITVSAVVGGSTLVNNDPLAPGGAHIAATNLANLTGIANFTFNSVSFKNYWGRFRLFARITTNDNTSASRMRFMVIDDSASALIYFTGETKIVPAPSGAFDLEYALVDLGYITLPPSSNLLPADSLAGIKIVLQASVPSGNTLKIYNIVLMPADEWFAEVTGQMDGVFQLQIDGIENPKKARALQWDKRELGLIENGKPIFHAHTQQRLWFLCRFASLTGNAAESSRPDFMASARLYKCQRYLHLRGD